MLHQQRSGTPRGTGLRRNGGWGSRTCGGIRGSRAPDPQGNGARGTGTNGGQEEPVKEPVARKPAGPSVVDVILTLKQLLLDVGGKEEATIESTN